MNHKAASGEQNIKLNTTSEESDNEMINTLNKSQKKWLITDQLLNKNEKKNLKRFSGKFLLYKRDFSGKIYGTVIIHENTNRNKNQPIIYKSL